MAGIGVESAAQQVLLEAAPQEYIEALVQEKKGLLPQLQAFSQELNACYQNIIQTDEIASQAELRRKSMMSQIENIEGLKDAIKEYIHSSSKGGADILLKNEMYQHLWRIRNDVYNIGQGKESQQKLTKIALQGMKLVYQLRSVLLNEPEEKIVVTFPEGGFRKETQIVRALEMSMPSFLDYAANASEQIIEFSNEAFSKQLYGDPYKLKLRSSTTILDQLKGVAESTGGRIYDLQVSDINGNKTNVSRNLYESLINNRNFLLRSDNFYDVVQKGQSGAVAEALIDATLNNTQFNYKKDSEVWYKKPDVIDASGQGYSVKNFIGGNPTLLRINSLHTVIDGLIIELSRTDISTKEMVKNIQSNIFGVTSGLDAAAEKVIEKLISEGLGI